MSPEEQFIEDLGRYSRDPVKFLAYIKTILYYNPESGFFTWLVQAGGRGAIGSRAGSSTGHSYRKLTINRMKYYEHIIAWLYMTGAWPDSKIDHKDKNGSNNKWNNLRACNSSQNGYNSKLRSDNTSGFRGVYFDNYYNIWRAVIWVNGSRKLIGSFDCKEKAAAAYATSAKIVAGEFASP